MEFSKWPHHQFEKTEGLEQLRALANGVKISAMETQHRLVGVDCPEDVALVEALLKE